ncbi:MAG TPA: hypothetical protein VHA82_15870 [Ramlibacter sp.]|uniref:hypothetical protein n=1 Tax=Ramlibacter sp. TaxID=1917967 RepID=UPI002C167EA9|nr:hypothetical protein [Ramlibacter sp.]HVZ45288.1 hypothetical protein [Ramlibacter sp.]
MLSDLLDPAAHNPRRTMFWWVFGAVILAQLAAIWLLCSRQVSLAQARDSDHQVLQVALSDCLQSTPGASIATCASRLMPAVAGAPTLPPPAN